MEVERQYAAPCGHLVFRRRDASVPAIGLVAQTGASALGKPFAAAVLRRIVEQILSLASRRPGPDRASSSLTSNPPLRLQACRALRAGGCRSDLKISRRIHAHVSARILIHPKSQEIGVKS